MRRHAWCAGLLGLALACLASPASAQAPIAPFSDAAPTIEREVAWAAALGAPDERVGRFEARRASARRLARARALRLLHAWADDALAGVHASPRRARAVHAAIDEAARVRAVRPLVDASAVVAIEVPLAALREACGDEGLPWTR